jgi:hypothetical protein
MSLDPSFRTWLRALLWILLVLGLFIFGRSLYRLWKLAVDISPAKAAHGRASSGDARRAPGTPSLSP